MKKLTLEEHRKTYKPPLEIYEDNETFDHLALWKGLLAEAKGAWEKQFIKIQISYWEKKK